MVQPEFGMLVLQSRHGLSLEATGKAVRDRPGWMRFCGLGIADRVPEANTLWDFREALIKAGELDALSAELERMINAAGFISRSGRMLDSSPVAAPRQRTSAGEKAAIKEGRIARDPVRPASAPRRRRRTRTHAGRSSPARRRPGRTARGCGRAWSTPLTPGAGRGPTRRIAQSGTKPGSRRTAWRATSTAGSRGAAP